MASTWELRIDPLTQAGFRPYGQVVGVRRTRPTYRSGGGSVGWLLDFHADGHARLTVSRTPFRALTFQILERHFHVTQTFIALDGSPAVIAVATRGADRREAVPKPDAVRAFLLSPGEGVLLSRGTWHSPARYPLRPPSSVFAVLSDHETADDPRLSQQVDYGDRYGLTFRMRLPPYRTLRSPRNGLRRAGSLR